MKLAKLDLDTFMNAVTKVNKLMENEQACNKLLDAARRDTPIIDQLMAEMNILFQCEDGGDKRRKGGQRTHILEVE